MPQKKPTVSGHNTRGIKKKGADGNKDKRNTYVPPRGRRSEKPKESVGKIKKKRVDYNERRAADSRRRELSGGGEYMRRQTSESVGLPALSPDMPLPELLVPCGSEEAVYAAVGGGADAVYCGGRLLNARMNAKNFGDEAMRRAIAYCHKNGVKVYVTLNTLVYDKELCEAAEYAEFLYSAGADGLIVADPGLCMLLREYLPDMELHASTQLSAHNLAAAKQLASLGFTRMVPARELSLRDIYTICRNSPIETEIFVHGALCVCRSGQCLMSSMIGGRSGNRGQCAQPCRLPYSGGYPLSLKDLCLAEHITELIACGVSSLKIEGRMKSPAYIRGVARIYRRLLDERRNAAPGELLELKNLFSRDGFTDAYFTDTVGNGMLGIRTERDKTASAAAGHVQQASVSETELPPAEGEALQKRAALPLCETAAVKHMSGGFPSQKKRRTARFLKSEQIPDEAQDYFELIALPPDEFIRNSALGRVKANAVVFPEAIHDSELDAVSGLLREARSLGAEHCYVGNIGHIALARELGFTLHGDFRLNITNSASTLFYDALGAFEEYILSPELTLPQIRDIRAFKSLIVYGRLPLMLLEKSCGRKKLTDRRGVDFPVREGLRTDGVRLRETVYNSCPVWMADRQKELSAAGIKDMHFVFTTETVGECRAVMLAYERKLPPEKGQSVRRIK